MKHQVTGAQGTIVLQAAHNRQVVGGAGGGGGEGTSAATYNSRYVHTRIHNMCIHKQPNTEKNTHCLHPGLV